jgi:hypothetical protein
MGLLCIGMADPGVQTATVIQRELIRHVYAVLFIPKMRK